MKKWDLLGKKVLVETPIFQFLQYKLFDNNKNSTHEFYIIDSQDWVNIVPITSDNKIVLIKQYRAGTGEITIEVPGGIIDAGETPEQTAKRELEEETGYIAKKYYKISDVYPNPAFITNKCHYVIAEDVELLGKIHFDPSEYIETFTVSMTEIGNMIKKGEITHAITLNAFLFLHLYHIKGFSL